MSSDPVTQDCDVLVIGGGIAGLAFALLLTDQPGGPALRVRVLERHRPPEPDPDAGIGLRVLAIAPAARALLHRCGVWAALPAGRASPYRRMRVWHAGRPPGGGLCFDAAELDLPELGHIVGHDLLRALLWERCAVDPGRIGLVYGSAPAALLLGGDRAAVELSGGGRITARLIVGADGAASWTRRELRVPVRRHGYGQRAVVTHVASARPHEETAWQCFRPGGPVALLPLADGRCSVVWSCPEGEAQQLLAMDAAEFGTVLTAATGQVLGELHATSPRVAFPLAAQHARRYTGARFALIGDAAHQVHPLAGQGINLGLLDAEALARTVADHQARFALADPGDAAVLRRYERERKGTNLLTLITMDGLHRAFLGDPALLARMAAAGLRAVDRLPAVKRRLADQAMGRPGRFQPTRD